MGPANHLLFILFLFGLSSVASADTIELVDGKKVEGKILTGVFRKEDKPEYCAEYDKIIEKVGGKA